MLIALRMANGLVGVLLILAVLTSIMDIALFVVPDLILATLLIVAALSPRGFAARALLAACGFASGVFTVATARYLADGEAVNPPLIAMLAVVTVSAVVLLVRPVPPPR